MALRKRLIPACAGAGSEEAAKRLSRRTQGAGPGLTALPQGLARAYLGGLRR